MECVLDDFVLDISEARLLHQPGQVWDSGISGEFDVDGFREVGCEGYAVAEYPLGVCDGADSVARFWCPVGFFEVVLVVFDVVDHIHSEDEVEEFVWEVQLLCSAVFEFYFL